MDTRFLESFLVVAESGSVAEAARRLNLSPAALTQRIRALEVELGSRLLTRAGRTVGVTASGRAILQRARLLLDEVRDLRALVTTRTFSGRLRVGAIATALTGLVPAILSGLSKSCPQIDVYLVPGTSGELYQKVLTGELDAGIFVQPPFGLPKSCDWMLLRKEPLVVISAAEVQGTDTRELLSRQPFIRYDRHHWGGRLADSYLKHAKIFPRERYELDALDAIAVLVARGLGVSLVPDWAPPWPANLSLNKVSLHAPAFMRRIGLCWMRDSVNLGLVQLFRKQARSLLAA
jgi:DNA-binding transcriptional LysR family regulator